MLIFFLTLVLALFIQPILGQSLEKYILVRQIDRGDNLKSYVCLLEHKGKQFVLKQSKGSADRTIIKCVLEAVGTQIAKSINIPCNSTEIVPASDPHHKFQKNLPATLHTFAQGKAIARCKKFKIIRIKQQCCSIPEDQKGLTLDIINCMHILPIFARLCALDTFIGNRDRHRGNLYYEEETETFTAIDFNNSGNINLADIAQKNIEALIRKKTLIENQAVEGLKIYQNTLKKLLKLHTPEKLVKNFETYLIKATPKSINKKISIELNIFHNKYKKFVRDTHNSTQKLISTIDKFIQIQKTVK